MTDIPTNDRSAADLIHWRIEKDSTGIIWLGMDKADGSANVLSGPVLRELNDVLESYRVAPPRGLVIHSGKPNGFIMGADINEFTKIDTPDEAYDLIRLGQQVLDKLGALRCPTVAAINGFALGGGFELALACDYRLVQQTDKAILGLPEVQLGIHPGFGGTVRAVRIAGVRAAMGLMLSGQPIAPGRARRQGFVDRIVTPDNWKQAAREMIASPQRPAHASWLDQVLNLGPLRPIIARRLRREVAKRARADHYPAPYAIIDLWVRHGASVHKGYEAEARSIAQLMCGETSRNLVRVFFLQNRLKSQGNKPQTRTERVHVVGAGVMGGDIAAWCALRGLDVTLQDREMKFIQPAMQRAAKLFEKKVRNESERAQTSDQLKADVHGNGVSEADLIIEAIFEDAQAKKELYATLEPAMKAGAVLASNTSSIRLEELRTGLEHPERFIGLHFFNPVAKLPLVEVVRCDDTAQEVLDIGFAFVKAIGKVPLECRSSPGFVVNRILAPYMAEAMYLAESGVPLPAIDRAAEDFGMPMGPVELLDTVGLDVALHVSEVLGAAFDKAVPSQLSQMVEKKQLGRKSGQGFYAWEDGKAVKPQAEENAKGGVPGDIGDRLILAMVNEAVACLHEGVVNDADLLDAGVIFGTGFAPFRGGPLKYARDRGIAEVLDALRRLQDKYGDRFRPHEGWSQLQEPAHTPAAPS
jgi:3-hydroxyacyl-CoA dehydrogenase/enoyl-CoA hydratase/3-hydroxybutyryl-CoA epimerase